MHKTLIVNFPGPATALTCRHPVAKQREKWDSAEDSFTFQAARAGRAWNSLLMPRRASRTATSATTT
jgi:hypothetical protein